MLTQQSTPAHVDQDEQPSALNPSAAVGHGVRPPSLFSSMLLLGLLLNRLFPLPFLPRRLTRPLGLFLVITGPILGAASAAALRRDGNSPRPDVPVKTLVDSGPYRYTRNPIYMSMVALYTGIAALANSRWAILFLPAVLAALNERMVGREEQYLEKRFGERYRDYKARVRRWI